MRRRRESAPPASNQVVPPATKRPSNPSPAQGKDARQSPPADLTWRRIDLHIHTPASADFQQPGTPLIEILRRAEERGLDCVALTDHNSVRGYANLWREIEDLELLEYLGRLEPQEAERLAEFRRLLSRILVLPGFEFTAQFGFHILAIFPEGTTVRMMEHILLLLGVPEDRFGSGEVGATTDVLRAYEILADHGALVIGAHVNSSHGIAMQGLRFGGQTKIAYTQNPNLHALEVTDLLPASNRRSTARFFSGVKSEYPRRMHCIQGSDAHRLEQDAQRESNLGIGDRPTEVLLPEMSFAALKALFLSDEFDRTRPFTPPPSDPIKAARLEGNTEFQAFHESAAAKRAQSAILRDAVALANSSGGHIYLGLSAAEKRPIAGVQDVKALISELEQEMATQIAPALPAVFEERALDGKTVVVIDVPEGVRKPYAILPGGIYVRRGAESALATRDEIVAMVTGGVAAAPSAPEAQHIAPEPVSENGHLARTGKRETRSGEVKQARQAAASRANEEQPTQAAEPTRPEVYEEPARPDPIAPTTGIEILDAYDQDGTRYYTLRDLRYHKLIYNVTQDTDRRLWRSAIGQREKGELANANVRWDGDYGLWRSYRLRTGERRYDLVYRGDGDPRVFYGVSESGMEGRWKSLLAPAPVVA